MTITSLPRRRSQALRSSADQRVLRAGIYCRISADDEKEGKGVARQLRDCRELLGKQFPSAGEPTVYVDNDVSAMGKKAREHYDRLVRDLKAGRLDVLVVWHTDRLYRRPIDLEHLILIVNERHVEFRACLIGIIDLTTPAGRMMARQFATMASYEVEHQIERSLRQKQEMREEGRFMGGGRNFGWTAGNKELHPVEARELQAAAERILRGDLPGDIGREWNARGILGTRSGAQWTSAKVVKVLRRASNAGLVAHQGEIVGPAEWPAILDLETWEAVHAILGKRIGSAGPRPPVAERLLSLIARCGRPGCDGLLRGGGNGEDGSPIYRCSRTPHLKRYVEPVDRYVEARVVDVLARPDLAELFGGESAERTVELRTKASSIRARLNDLGALFATGDIDALQLKEATARLRAQQEEVDRQLADLAAGTVLDGVAGHPDADALWPTLPLSRKRAIIDALFVITVLPGRRGGSNQHRRQPQDPASTIRIEPKHEALAVA